MAAGADSMANMTVLRPGRIPLLSPGVRAPSTLGTFVRAMRFGHVRQLDAVAARFLNSLNTRARLARIALETAAPPFQG